MNRFPTSSLVRSLVLFLVCAVLVTPAIGVEFQKKKSTDPRTSSDRTERIARIRPVTHSLESFFVGNGSLTLSVNGLGTNLSFGTIEVVKPPGGMVKAAFLMAAATGSYAHYIEDGEIQVDGHRVVWEKSIRNAVGSWNALADVTRLIKPSIDAAPAGRVIVDIWEDQSELIDGVILVIVFEDPNTRPDNDVALFFGAHGTRRDSFEIDLPRPVPSNFIDRRFELGVGISFGLQSSETRDQYTIIEINGQRLTTSAGGPDDGSPMPGALITVGGVDDHASNPEDAHALPQNLLSDDEFYDLKPFLMPGDSTIHVATASPSSEENFFFACFFATGKRSDVAAISAAALSGVAVGTAGIAADEIMLVSSSSANRVGSPCEITATVRSQGVPLAGVDVGLRIVEGPHAGAVSQARTDSTGRTTFLYRGKSAGRDLLVAVIDDGDGVVAGSNPIICEWVEETLDLFVDIAPGVCPNAVDIGMQDLVTVALVGNELFDVENVEVTSLYLENAAPTRIQYRDVSRPGDGSECACTSDGGDGFQDLVLQFKVADVLPDVGSITNEENRTWTLVGKTKEGTSFETSNCVTISKASGQAVELRDDILSPLGAETTETPR
jgi:hypothetical protein